MRASSIVACAFSCWLFSASAGAQSPVPDIPYGPLPHQLFDYYPAIPMPDDPTGPRPWVLFVHGTGSDKSGIGYMGFGVMLDILRRNNIAVFAANWAKYPAVYPAMLEDIALAIQHIKSQASAFDIQKDQMILWGVSGGAVIAGWLAFGPDFQKFGAQGAKGQSTRPIALMNWGGLTNFLLMDPNASGLVFGVPTLGQLSQDFLKSVSMSYMVTDVQRSYTPPVQSYYGWVSDPPPFKNPHDVGFMKDLHQKLNAAYPAVASQSMQLQNLVHPHIVYEQLEDLAEWTRHCFGLFGPLDLGHDVAGTTGFPKLYGDGDFSAGGSFSLSFRAARHEPTLLALVSGAKRSTAMAGPIALVPEPSIALVLATDAAGALDVQAPLPPWLPAGIPQYLQFVHYDSGAADGVAASNAIRIVTE